MDIKLAGEIVNTSFGERIETIIPIIGMGSVNKIFVVKTHCREVVVRMSDAETALQTYEKERWCLEQTSAKNIPGPAVLKIGKLGTVAYMVQTRLIGDNGVDSPVDKALIWYKLGQYAKIFHSITIKSSTQLANFDNFEISWSRFLAYNIESLTSEDELIKLGLITFSQSVKIRLLFEKLKTRQYQYGLCHRDIALRNTIVADNETVHLLDWGCAEINIVPHTELAQFLEWQLTENYPDQTELTAFLAGYGITPPEFEAMQVELETLTLLRAFDTVRWAIERYPAGLASRIEIARKVLQACEERI